MTVIKSKRYIIIPIITLIVLLICSYKIYAMANKVITKKLEIETPVINQTIVTGIDKIRQESIVLENNKSTIIEESVPTATVNSKTYQGYEVIAILKIPSIGIEYPVLAETSAELMEISLNKYWGGNPNEVGNFCIIGHNYKSGKHFGKLKNVKMGDKVILTDDSERTITYEVYDTYVIDPYDTKCTSQLTDGKKEVTLITCSNQGKNRLVVKAREI